MIPISQVCHLLLPNKFLHFSSFCPDDLSSVSVAVFFWYSCIEKVSKLTVARFEYYCIWMKLKNAYDNVMLRIKTKQSQFEEW